MACSCTVLFARFVIVSGLSSRRSFPRALEWIVAHVHSDFFIFRSYNSLRFSHTKNPNVPPIRPRLSAK